MATIPLHFSGGGGSGSTDVTASSAQVLAGYTAVTTDSNDEPMEGIIPSKSAATYNTATSDRTIAAGQYLSGDQTIKAVTTANLTAGNIKKGVVVKVGDAHDDDRVLSISGSYTTPSSGQTAATPAQILSGYSGFVNGGSELKGSIASKAAATYNTSTSDQTIAAGQYLSGVQTIKAVTTANITAANVKKGVVVQVGDANSAGRIVNVTGTYTTISSGQTAVAADKMVSGYSGFANGGAEVKGSITAKAAATYNVSTSDQTIASGQYLTGAQTIRAVTTSNISAGNIKKGVVVKVGDANDDDRIATATGTYTTISSGQTACTAASIVSGYSGFASGSAEVKGSITNQAATTYNASTSDRTIAAKTYLSGAGTIKAITTSGISAANIKKGVVVKVGDANDDDRIATATGSYTTVSSGQTACTAASMRTGYSGFANGSAEVKGSADTAAATYNTSTSDQTISAPRYLTGAQTIKAVTTSGISAGNIKKGVTVTVGDANSATRIANVAGTYTTVSSGQTAVIANALYTGYSGFANGGSEVKGAVTDLAAQTITPGTANKTIAAGKLTTGVQTIKGDANLVAANIKTGVAIFGVTGTASGMVLYTGTAKASTATQNFYTSADAAVARYYISLSAHSCTPAALVAYRSATTYTANDHIVCNGTYIMRHLSSVQMKATKSPAVWTKASIVLPEFSSGVTYNVRVCGY